MVRGAVAGCWAIVDVRPNRGGDGTKADVVDRAAAAARVTKADRRIILLLLSESGMFCCLIFVREQVLKVVR